MFDSGATLPYDDPETPRDGPTDSQATAPSPRGGAGGSSCHTTTAGSHAATTLGTRSSQASAVCDSQATSLFPSTESEEGDVGDDASSRTELFQSGGGMSLGRVASVKQHGVGAEVGAGAGAAAGVGGGGKQLCMTRGLSALRSFNHGGSSFARGGGGGRSGSTRPERPPPKKPKLELQKTQSGGGPQYIFDPDTQTYTASAVVPSSAAAAAARSRQARPTRGRPRPPPAPARHRAAL